MGTSKVIHRPHAADTAREGDDLLYRFEGRFTKLVPVGPVPDGFRMHNSFAGSITRGELEGASVEGIDYFRIRPDGIGIVDGWELVTFHDERIAVRITGYILPPAGLPQPSVDQLMDPAFAWPDAPFTIGVLATFETASPAFSRLNSTVAAHTGTANMRDGSLRIDARVIAAPVAAASSIGSPA